LNSEPEVTRRNKIFPGHENSGTGENLGKSFEMHENHFGVSRMNFFRGKVGVHTRVGGDFQSDIEI
jgi:hypothetical protein